MNLARFVFDKYIKPNMVSLAKEVNLTGELTKSAGRWQTRYNEYAVPDVSFSTIKEMRKHGQVNLALKIIKLPLMGLNWWVECEDKDIANFVQNELLKPIWKSLLKTTLVGVDYGFAPHEKVFEMRNGKWVYKKIKPVDPTTVDLKRNDETDSFDGFVQDNIIKVEAEKAFVYVHDIDVDGNMYGRGRVILAKDPWYYLTAACYPFYMRYLERRGMPAVKAWAPPEVRKTSAGEDVDCLDEAKKMGEALMNEMVVAFPAEYDQHSGKPLWGLEYMVDDKRGEQFLDGINHMLMLILRYMLVPERIYMQATEVGSYSMARVHEDMFFQGEMGLINEVIDYFNKYVIPQPIVLNFGQSAPMAYIKTEPLRQENREILSEILIKLIEITSKIGTVPKDFPIDLVNILEQLNVPIVKEDEQAEKWEEKEEKLMITLESVKSYFKRAEKEHLRKMEIIFGKQKEQFLNDVRKALSDSKRVMDRIENINVKYKDDFVSEMKSYVKNAYTFGIKSAKNELGVTEWIPADSKDLKYWRVRAESISKEQFAAMEGAVMEALMDGLKGNMTDQDIIFQVSKALDKIWSTRIVPTASTELVKALNDGRNFVAKKFS
jgi:hypothetical protein